MDPQELIDRARVVVLPLVERFRGLREREAVLIDAPNGWVEWSPFAEYGDAEAARWLGGAIDEGWRERIRPLRASVGVNATVPAVAAGGVAALLERFPGVRTAKVKVAEHGDDPAADVDRVAAVREVLGPAGRIRVDANGAWSPAEAERAIAALLPFGLEYVEQPCATIAELVELRTRLGGAVRIAADESVRKADDPLAVARAGAADLLVVKPQPLGGARRAMAIVLEAGLPVIASSALETSVGLAAAVRFAATLPGDVDHGLGTAALFAADVTTDPLLPVGGALSVRDVAPDPELLDRHAADPDRTAWWLARLERCARVYRPE